MLNSKNEAKVGHNTVAEAFVNCFPSSSADLTHVAYFSVLYGLAAALEPQTIVEIGCQYGISTRAFLAATPRVDRELVAPLSWEARNSPPRILHSIDVDPKAGHTTLAVVTGIGCHERWRFHLGRSQELEPIECDLLYVDGDHSYEAVCSDMARWGTRVRDGGLVVLDDYHWSWPGKVRWVKERQKEIDPLIIGPIAVVRVTPEKREVFKRVYS